MSNIPSETAMQLLYMEDDAGLARLCQARLQRQGYHTTIATDAKQGISLCEQYQYDALLIDYNLPFHNGLEVIRILQQKNCLPSFIMVTGRGDERIAVEAMKQGAFDYVIKDAQGHFLESLPLILNELAHHKQIQNQQQDLDQTSNRYQKMIESNTDLICCFSPNGQINFVNACFCEYFATSKSAIIGQYIWHYMSPDYHRNLQDILDTLVDAEAIQWLDYEVDCCNKIHCGSSWINASIQIFSKIDDKIEEFQLIGHDVSNYKKIETTLQSRQKRLDLITSAVGDGVVMLDANGYFTFINPQASQLLGQTDSRLNGQFASQYLRFSTLNPEHFLADLQRHSNHHQDDMLIRKDGTQLPISFISTPIIEQNKLTGMVVAFHDISERKQLETQLQKQRQKLESNNHKLKRLLRLDSLTGLANRRYFNEAFEHEWQKALFHQYSLTVVMIDVDFFKAYNDHYGHQVGDVCLKWVAKALKNSLYRANDLMARYGGEEFVALLPANQDNIQSLAERFCKRVRDLKIPHQKSQLPCRCVTISAGVASVIPTEQQNLQNLLRAADKALYMAKAAGRDQVYYAKDMSETFQLDNDIGYPN